MEDDKGRKEGRSYEQGPGIACGEGPGQQGDVGTREEPRGLGSDATTGQEADAAQKLTPPRAPAARPPTGSEPREDQVAKYEALLEYSRETFHFYHDRWSDIDGKAGVYVTLPPALLGAGALSVREVLDALDKGDGLSLALVGAYVAFLVFGMVASIFFLYAVAIGTTLTPPGGTQTVSYFTSKKYADVLDGLSKTYLRVAESTKSTVTKRTTATRRGERNLYAALLCAAVALGIFSYREWEDIVSSKDSGSQVGGDTAPAVSPPQETPQQDSDAFAPSGNVAPLPFEEFQRNDKVGGDDALMKLVVTPTFDGVTKR